LLAPLRRLVVEIHRRSLWQVVVVYLVGATVAYQLIQSLVEGLGLPEWVPGVSVVLFIIGLPVVVATALVREAPRKDGSHADRGSSGRAGRRSTSSDREASIRLIVLPFSNLGPSEHQYFARGITEEITTRLVKLREIRVISRNTATALAAAERTTGEIGRELDVDYVLEGSVLSEPSPEPRGLPRRVRIIPQLIRVSDDTHVWTDRYEFVLEDLFEVQSEIAECVARALDLHLVEPELRALEARPTDDMEAYGLYLKGNKYFADRFLETDARTAIRLYEQAVDRDPGFALAHAALARARVWLHSQFGRFEELAPAKAAAAEAVRLAPSLPEARMALADVRYYGERDFPAALAEYRRALESQPGNSDAIALSGLVLRRLGRLEESYEEVERALELDPRNTVWLIGQTQTLLHAGRLEEAERPLRRVLELAPDVPYYHAWAAWLAFAREGRIESVRRIVEEARSRFEPAVLFTDIEVGWLFTDLLADEWVEELELLRPDAPGLEAAWVHIARGEARHARGDGERARVHWERAHDVLEERVAAAPPILAPYQHLGFVLARLDRRSEAMVAARRAVELLPPERDFIDGAHRILFLARTATLCGEGGEAVEAIDRVSTPIVLLTPAMLRSDPFWAPLRDTPGFRALARGS
jgi:TolB-like protein/Flp pilus assembly protein TadD